MKGRNRKRVPSGTIRQIKALVNEIESIEKISSQATEFHSLQTQNRHFPLDYKLHHGLRSISQSLSRNTMDMKTPDNSS
jgi:hypothetical protein